MPDRRYVLLRHECPADYRDGPHWDLMIEDGDALRTWSLLELPEAWRIALAIPNRTATVRERNQTVFVTELAPHRRVYLDYEGPVSRGRGTVRRVASGTLRLTQEDAGQVGVEALTGELRGAWRFEREGDGWRLRVESADGPSADGPGANASG